MSMRNPVAQLRIARDPRETEAALNGALLRQTGLLSTLITSRRESSSEAGLGQAELMRLVKAQQALLSATRELPSSRKGAEVTSLKAGQRARNDAGEAFVITRRAA